ncbi:MAG: sulfotransferase [Bacteroidetes bacterium]|nr:sulfotransferase [Bacteroidota bacterium]
MLNSNYNFSERLVHQFALGSRFISKASFDFEEILCGSAVVPTDGKHLFISGLARSGTTALMNCLYDTKKYKSLSYLDMPFVLMPNGWKKLHRQASVTFEKSERAHGDGILVGKDSPEAFEEVFWRVFNEHDYIFKDHLGIHKVNNETLRLFRKFVNHVLLSRDSTEQNRYLSKNNNNILRIPSLLKAFPNAYVLTTFRDPLQHAISLYNQHKKFTVIHGADKFTLNYMSWLGHFEFGLNHKPFQFGDIESYNELKKYSTADINYWLLIWRNYYRYLIDYQLSNVLLFCFENYCANPNKVLKDLLVTLDVDQAFQPVSSFKPKIIVPKDINQDILKECMAIYLQLAELTIH